MTKKKQNKSIARRTDADRRLRQAARLADHLRLVHLLLGRSRWDAKLLAEELECTERTVYRYLKVLEFAGIPVVYDKDIRCYRVRPDVKFPVLKLSNDELLEQATAATICRASGLDAGADGEAVTRRLAASSRDEIAQLLADIQSVTAAIDLKLADHSKHHDTLKTIQWAMVEGKQLRGEYRSPYKDTSIDITINPYRVCLSGQAWYLIGVPEGGDEPRTYRVMRFRSIRLLDQPAIVPEEFDLDDYFGNAWNVFRGAQRYEVAIEFTPDAAELVAETVWHKTQAVKKHSDGRATLTFSVDGLDEIVWWVLGWAGRAKVLQPAELRQLVVEKLQHGLELNQEQQ